MVPIKRCRQPLILPAVANEEEADQTIVDMHYQLLCSSQLSCFCRTQHFKHNNGKRSLDALRGCKRAGVSHAVSGMRRWCLLSQKQEAPAVNVGIVLLHTLPCKHTMRPATHASAWRVGGTGWFHKTTPCDNKLGTK